MGKLSCRSRGKNNNHNVIKSLYIRAFLLVPRLVDFDGRGGVLYIQGVTIMLVITIIAKVKLRVNNSLLNNNQREEKYNG